MYRAKRGLTAHGSFFMEPHWLIEQFLKKLFKRRNAKMMKLSTMLRVASTVDDEWRSPLAEKILEAWGYDAGSVYALRYSANFIFVFKRGGNPYFLRFNDVTERDLRTLEAEMEILEYLSGKGLLVAEPVRSLNNKKIERVAAEQGTFYGVVFKALPGKQYEPEELEDEQFRDWGSALGQLHEAFKGMAVSVSAERPSWRDQLHIVIDRLPDDETAAKKVHDYLLKWAEQLPVTKETFGLIHYDFELDNQRWDDNSIGMLDFDDCARYWYVADIAYALRELESLDGNRKFNRFVEGYMSKTEVDISLLKELTNFQILHDLITFAKLLRSVDVSESENLQEWMMGLRAKLVQKINSYRDSFEEMVRKEEIIG
jgi:Ser/Thr protein kinase RdoA (MazF antagonist)